MTKQSSKMLKASILIFLLFSTISDKNQLKAISDVAITTIAELAITAIAAVALELSIASQIQGVSDKSFPDQFRDIFVKQNNLGHLTIPEQDAAFNKAVEEAAAATHINTTYFITKEDAASVSSNINIATRITSSGLPEVRVESKDGAFHAGAKCLTQNDFDKMFPLSAQEKRELAVATNAKHGIAVDHKMALFTKALTQLVENNKDTNPNAVPEQNIYALALIAKLDFTGYPHQAELEQIRDVILALHANENGLITQLEGCGKGYTEGLNQCSKNLLNVNRSISQIVKNHFNGLSGTDITSERLYKLSSKLPNTTNFTFNKKTIASINARKADNLFLVNEILKDKVSAPNPQIPGHKEIIEFKIKAACKEQGIPINSFTWQGLSDYHKYKVLNEPQSEYSKDIVHKCHLEPLVQNEFINFFGITEKEARNSKFKRAFKEVIETVLDKTKTSADLRNLLLDIASGRKHPYAKKYFTLANSVFKNHANSPFAQRVKIDESVDEDLKYRSIDVANKLLDVLKSPEGRANYTAPQGALRLFGYTDVIPQEEATILAEGVVKAFKGDPFYKPLLSEREHWPFALRPFGIKQADKDFVAEQARIFKDHESKNSPSPKKPKNDDLSNASACGLASYHKYTLSKSSQKLLEECSIDQKVFTDLVGNKLQKELHHRLIENLNEAAILFYKTESADLKDYCKGVAYAAEAGCKANQQGQIISAEHFADFCQHATAFGRGVLSSCGNNIHAIKQALLHPFDTVSEIAIFAKNATLSLAKAVINHDLVQEYERMELYGLDIENMEGYKCAKEQLEQTYKTIDTYIEAATNQSSEEFCENLGYILTDAALYLYGPKGTKVAKNNFNKAIERGKKFFANFGEIGTESAMIVGLAGTEGVYRVEEALNILKQEGQVAKPKKLFGQVEKTVETSAKTAKSSIEIKANDLVNNSLSKSKSPITDKLNTEAAFKARKEHAFSKDHAKKGIFTLGNNELDIYNKSLEVAKKVELCGLLKEGDNQILTYINGLKVEIRLNINQGDPRSFNIMMNWSNREMFNRIKILGEIL